MKKWMALAGRWIVANPRLTIVIALVLAAHVYAVWCLANHSANLAITPRRSVAVQTITLREPPKPKPPPAAKPKPKPVQVAKPVVKPKPVAVAKPTPKPVVKPKPVVVAKPREKPVAAPIVKAIPKPKPTVTPAIATPNPQLELLASIEESLDKLTENTHISTAKPIGRTVKQIGSLTVDRVEPNRTADSGPSRDYRTELAQRLRLILKLPDYGEVHVAVTVDSKGSVKSVSVKESHSKLNQAYVEETLPTLTLLPLDPFFPGKTQHSFSLVLRNEG